MDNLIVQPLTQNIVFNYDNKYSKVYKCNSFLVNITDQYRHVCKKICNDIKIDVMYTYMAGSHPSKKIFVRGYVYFNGKEYECVDYTLYKAFKIDNLVYDNIGICNINENFLKI
jgi:hypothetical protein